MIPNESIQLDTVKTVDTPTSARWNRSRSCSYARAKATILTLVGRNHTGSVRDAAQGHAAFISMKNTHDHFLEKCRPISSDSEGRTLWSTPSGELWTPAGASAKYVAGIVAEQVVDTYSHPSLPDYQGEVILDCGGNIGMFTHHAIQHGAEQVIVFEPSSENALCLRRNMESQIRAGRVHLVETAIGDHEGELWLDTSNRGNPGSWTISANTQSRGQSVKITTIDSVVEELKLTRVDRIKIDVEGYEVKVIRGGASTLRRFSPNFAVAVEHVGQDPSEVASAIQEDPWIKTRYRLHYGFHRCDDARRLHPQILYFVKR